MTIPQVPQSRIRARKDSSDEESLSDSEAQDAASETESALEAGPSDENALDLEEDSSNPEQSNPPLSPISNDPSSLSFGALARAQEALGKRSRATSEAFPLPKRLRPSHDSQSTPSHPSKVSLPARASKHAPTTQSSKYAVSRRREVVAVPKVVARDPRFDPLTGPLDGNRVAQTYSFLSDYRSSEIAQLKSAIRSTKDLSAREKLQKALRRMESRRKAEQLKEESQRVVREHRKEEKERVREGKRPFYLKKAEQKTRVLEKRFEDVHVSFHKDRSREEVALDRWLRNEKLVEILIDVTSAPNKGEYKRMNAPSMHEQHIPPPRSAPPFSAMLTSPAISFPENNGSSNRPSSRAANFSASYIPVPAPVIENYVLGLHIVRPRPYYEGRAARDVEDEAWGR
ncbi:MAG: hypothetical protein Q9195_001596 [Heterodermia aff. obscurata]